MGSTLPVGQTFLWHRQPLRREGFVRDGDGNVKHGVDGESLVERVEVERIDESSSQAFIKHEPIDDTLHLITTDASLNNDPSHATEEWSRAIPHPRRIIFLRQTPRVIHYASRPSFPAADRTYLLDLFNMHVTAPHGSLARVYDAWAGADPALFGKAMGKGRVPRGVRVLRQDPWECLIS